MKTLFVLRHAKSSWDSGASIDFERPLNARGHQAAKAMGREMRRLRLRPEATVASPAARVVETLAGLAEGWQQAVPIAYDRRLYAASSDELLEVVRSTDKVIEQLLLVGHNPGLQRLVLSLSRDENNGLRSRVAIKFPTAALAEIQLAVERWRDVERGIGRIVRFLRPCDLGAKV